MPSKEISKIKPLCPVFGQCGGCLYQDIVYQEELSLKERQLKTLFDSSFPVDRTLFKPIVGSPKEYHYRHRVDLKLVKSKTRGIFIGYTPKEGRGVLAINECAIATEKIDQAIGRVKEEAINKLTEKYRQANLVVRVGDNEQVRWGGIGRRSLELKEEDYLWAEVNGKKIFYSLDTFFQANLSILPKLFDYLYAQPIWDNASFYDLYGGVGLFGILMAEKVNKVTLIEEVGASIKLARYNLARHQLKNFEIIEGRMEDQFLSVLKQQADNNVVAMIDPPRAGLSADVRGLLTDAENINHLLYLSCNPEALVRDLKNLCESKWKIKEITPFDFFPKTKHLETLVSLTRQTL